MTFYQKTIDLHNLIETEAISKVILLLFELGENDFLDSIKIITGRGDVLRYLVIGLIEEENFTWEYDSTNDGAIIVYK